MKYFGLERPLDLLSVNLVSVNEIICIFESAAKSIQDCNFASWDSPRMLCVTMLMPSLSEKSNGSESCAVGCCSCVSSIDSKPFCGTVESSNDRLMIVVRSCRPFPKLVRVGRVH